MLTVTEHFTDGTIRVTKWGETPPLNPPKEIMDKINRILAEAIMARGESDKWIEEYGKED